MKTEHELQRKRGLKTKNADSPSRKNFKKKSLPTVDELEGSVSCVRQVKSDAKGHPKS